MANWTRRGFLPLSAGLALAPGLVFARQGPSPTAPSATSDARSATTPSKLDTLQTQNDAANRLTVPVMLNGQGPFAFMVDTGAERSVISQTLAEKLALPVGPSIMVHGVAGDVTVTSALLARIDVGARTLSDKVLPVLMRQDLGADGVLGIDALQGQRIFLDFFHNQIVVEAGRPRGTDPDDIVISARPRYGQLVLVDSSFRREPILVVVDTGAEVSIGNLAMRRMIESARRADPTQHTNIESVTGQNTTGDWGLASHLKVGEMTINNLPVVYSDLNNFRIWKLDDQPAMLLGMDLLRTFDTVQIDFARREVRFRVPREISPVRVTS